MAKHFINLVKEGYDFIETSLTYAPDDIARQHIINAFTVEELKPVLKANGVRGISKMRKADMIDALVELAHQRKAEHEENKAEQTAA